MAKVRVHDSKDIKWFKIRDSFRADLLTGVDEPTLDSHVTVHEHGDEKLPHMSEADYQPFADIAVHSHSADEVIYVVSGSMIVGNRELKAGSSMFVAAETLYGFKAGAEGLRMVVFRPIGKDHSLSKDEYMARKAAQKNQDKAAP
jgi:quercetin dioxygenase-like cupin family protein